MFLQKQELKQDWIWPNIDKNPNQWAIFRAKYIWNGNKTTAIISADSKYYLYINGELAVFEGSLNRGPKADSGYADRIDLTSYLKSGENTIAVLVWFWGNEGRNNVNSGAPGFYFEIEKGETPDFKAIIHPAYCETAVPCPAYLYGGHNVGFDARRDIGDFTSPDFDDSKWGNAISVSGTELYRRPIPQIRFKKPCEYEKIKKDDSLYICSLPYAMHLTPILKVKARAGCVIDIRTDRYTVHGGPGDEKNQYNGHRAEYITREGEQSFEVLNWLFGEQVIYNIPAGVEVLALTYRESDYASDITVTFESFDKALDRLVKKAQRTLKVCMRDNFMDCPDRERGQWIGDVSVQAPQALMSLDENAGLLLKKAIFDFVNWRIGDALVGNVPGIHRAELPSQSLCAISRRGMIAWYEQVTGDLEPLRFAFDAIEKYLLLWEIKPNGLVRAREGHWYWFDHCENIDAPVLENAWYYDAIEYYISSAEKLNITPNAELYRRREQISKAFEENFRHNDGYRSGDINDERANALAVLTGLADKKLYPAIIDILDKTRFATPYMEAFVLDALFTLGEGKIAIKRMKDRYAYMDAAGNSTLWEDFSILGTKNHAWSGAPLTVALKEIAGLRPDGAGSFTVNPNPDLIDTAKITIKTKKGKTVILIDNGKARIEQNYMD